MSDIFIFISTLTVMFIRLLFLPSLSSDPRDKTEYVSSVGKRNPL